jgi:hypothetical protein
MKTILGRLIDRFVPTGLVPRRRKTETVLRGLYEKYNDKPLEQAFRQFHFDDKQIKTLFDAVDKMYGARMWSGDPQEMGRAVDDAFKFLASVFAAAVKPLTPKN